MRELVKAKIHILGDWHAVKSKLFPFSFWIMKETENTGGNG